MTKHQSPTLRPQKLLHLHPIRQATIASCFSYAPVLLRWLLAVGSGSGPGSDHCTRPTEAAEHLERWHGCQLYGKGPGGRVLEPLRWHFPLPARDYMWKWRPTDGIFPFFFLTSLLTLLQWGLVKDILGGADANINKLRHYTFLYKMLLSIQ